MFTGLVEALSRIQEVRPQGPGIDFFVERPGDWTDIAIGDSVSINGCCLTVVECAPGQAMVFQAGSETCSRTNLGELKAGDAVNLERALAVGDRLGGHYVTGHIDAVGEIQSRTEEGDWSTFRIKVPAELTRQMASKGSVAVDGVSLTLVDVGPDWFTVALIPHTLSVTTLGRKAEGDRVNIETDVLAKYVQQQLAWWTNRDDQVSASREPDS